RRGQMLCRGLSDRPASVVGRKARKTGNEGLRARASAVLADLIGWDRARGVYCIGVPDMAVGPLYYSLYDAVCVTVSAEFPDGGKGLKQTNTTPLTPAEVEEMVQLLMEADAQTIWNLITTHLRNGKSLSSLGDTIQLGGAEQVVQPTGRRH